MSTLPGADLASPSDLGPRFTFVTADVTDEAAVTAVLAVVPDRLDGVVHAAGVAGGGRINTASPNTMPVTSIVGASSPSPSVRILQVCSTVHII
jgi:nucleoside-diphosphate-sugar epimerase